MVQAKSFGRAYWLTLALLWPGGTALAQSFPAGTASVTPQAPSNDPADRLAANLVLLSQNPKNISALIDAGRSAIAIGDYDAALSFLARAEELAPSDGRVKAALGSTLVMVERPADAIRLFAEASALGVSEFEIASDRGLAHDLLGDNRRAQRDYQIALRSRSDDEVVRRLALSLGISGDRDQALRILDPLLRRQDPTGWRARAFVLAMNGDVRSAENIAASVMPSGMGDTMRPFLRKLASLNAADRAHAVNFGTMPSDSTRFASVDTTRLIPAPELASATAGEQLAKPRKGEGSSKAPRRRPGKDDGKLASAAPTQVAKASQVGPGFSDIFLKSSAPQTAKIEAPKPIETARLDQRVGARIGPVDPERLPPEVRAALARGGEKLPPKVTVVQGGVLPPPDQRRPDEKIAAAPVPAAAALPVATVLIRKAPEPEEIDQPANAVFEVPAGITPKPEEKPLVAVAAVTVAKPLETLPKPVIEAFPKPAVEARAVVLGPPAEQPAPLPSTQPPAQSPAQSPAQAPTPAATQPPVQLAVVTQTPIVAKPDTVTQLPEPVATPSPARGLAGLLSDIEPEQESVAIALPTEAQIKIARIAAQRKIADAAAKVKAEKDGVAKAEKAKLDKEAAEAAALAKRNPPRVWVQVATGANESGLGITWRRLREKAPDAFKGLSASYAPFKATNRVLVGPFKNNTEARSLVNAMSKAGISGNTFASEAGQEILKIASK